MTNYISLSKSVGDKSVGDWSLSVFQLSHRNAHKTHLNLLVVCSNLSVTFVLINQFLA